MNLFSHCLHVLRDFRTCNYCPQRYRMWRPRCPNCHGLNVPKADNRLETVLGRIAADSKRL